MIRKLLAGGAIALALTSAVQAGVVYGWVPTRSGTPGAVSARLEVSQDAFNAGAFEGSVFGSACPFTGCIEDPPIIGFSFSRGVISDLNINFRRRDFTAANARLMFNADGTLSGSIRAFDQETTVAFGGTGAQWGVTGFESETGNPSTFCGRAGSRDFSSCTASGYWLLAGAPPINVPLPDTLALLVAAGLGLGLARRAQRPHVGSSGNVAA